MIAIPGYQIKSKIFESNNSSIYQGKRNTDDKPVIFKFLNSSIPRPDDIARYKHEFQILTHLNDIPHAINVYDLETYDSLPVLVLEDFGAISLKDFLTSTKISISDIVLLGIQIIEALASVHAAGIIHKDLNPSNILVNKSLKKIKIIDFGIASILPRETPSLINPGELVGSLNYISPEQTGRMNQNLDYRTDFYSFGISLYEMLTDKLPYESEDPIELIHYHLAHLAIPPRSVNGKIPDELSNVVLKLISKNAEDRYQSTNGIIEDLKKCLSILNGNNLNQEFQLGSNDISEQLQIPQKLFGREKEIETLISAFGRINKKAGSLEANSELILVSGYSGIGKTTLVREIYKPVTEYHGYFISGKYEQLQKQKPYLAIVEAFSDLIKQLLMESEDRLSNWRNKINSALGTNAQIIVDVIPELELITGPSSSVSSLPPIESQNRFNLVFKNFVDAFVRSGNPLVIFLDDLQWADTSSLKLIEYLMTSRESNFLLIGAFRRNEVGLSHPVRSTQKRLENSGIKTSNIDVSPLKPDLVNRFIAETLNKDQFTVKPLSELIAAKTDGNPFYIIELLKSLYEKQAIVFNRQNGTWSWSLEKVNAANVSGNIVELLADKIKRLEDESQQVLKIASCIGGRFNLETLSCFLEISPLEATIALRKIMVLAPGLIYPVGESYKLNSKDNDSNIEFRFMHDRIQQAAYSMIPVNDRKFLHRNLGRLLIENTSGENKENRIFDIVNQLNQCTEIISKPVEKLEITQLNLIAGMKAKNATAYAQSLDYLKIAIENLSHYSWTEDYDLSLRLYTEGAEVSYLCGDHDYVNELTTQAFNNIKDLTDRVKIYDILIQSSYGQGKPIEAIRLGLNILNLLKFKLPKNPKSSFVVLFIVWELFRIQHKLHTILKSKGSKKTKKIESISNPTESQQVISTSNIIKSLASSLQTAFPELMGLMLLKSTRMFLNNGITAETPAVFSGVGMLLCNVIGNVKLGLKFGDLALSIADLPITKAFKGRLKCVIGWAILPWKTHFRDTLEYLLNANNLALENGDIEYSAHSIHMYLLHMYVIGKPLIEVNQAFENHVKTIKNQNQGTILNFITIHHQAVKELMMVGSNEVSLQKQNEIELIFLDTLKKEKDYLSIFFVYLHKTTLSYLLDETDLAIEFSDKMEHLWDTFPSPTTSIGYLYGSLARLSIYNKSLPHRKKRKILKYVNKNQTKLKKWSSYAPMNFLNKWTLVQAELFRVLGQDERAIEYYDQAIELSKQNHFLQEEALANELTAKFWLNKGKTEFAKLYFNKAYYKYEKWGARAKLNHLEKKYSQLIADPGSTYRKLYYTGKGSDVMRITSGTDTDTSIDLKSVIKASQAISSEILLPSLLKKMMSILIENTGAERGWLLIENDNQYFVEAMKEARDRYATVLESVSLNDPAVSQTLPLDIIHYVARTSETVVLDNATQDGKFVKDPNLARREVKSVLCSPILSQNKTLGIIYLENNLAKGAFTNNRVEILQHLSSYMAISIENARLYEDLKDSEEKYRSIFEKATEGIFQSTVNGEILEANPAFIKIFGYSSLQELKERFNLLSDNLYVDKERKNERIELLHEKGFAENFEYQALKCNGSIIDVSENVRLAKNEDNKTVYLEGIITDISQKKHLEELKSAKEKSDAANQAKTDFLADISHELRTPMHGILGFAKLGIFKARSKNVEKMIEYYEEIKKSGERLLLLLNDLLDLSKLEAGRISIDYNYVSISELIITIIKELHPLSSEKGLGIIYDKPAFSDKAEIDDNKMGQVVRNLISNAIKFSDEGGQVKVSLLDNDFDFQISVEDEGIGIPENELITVFDKFKQSSRTKSSGEGTGLGLAISKQIMKSHHGQIWAENNPRGGTIFHCSFPKSRKN